MRRLMTGILTVTVVLSMLLMGRAPTPASADHSGSMHFPSADYCGWVYRDWRNPAHNGLDIWTSSNAGGLYASDPQKGYPVHLAMEGVFQRYLTLVETGEANQVYGLEFYHPSLNVTTFYWHLAPKENTTRTYVQLGYVIGQTYPAGTFLGYQGNLSAKIFNDATVHLHFTVTAGRAFDSGNSPATDPNMLDPTPYFNYAGRNFNGATGGDCYLAQTIQYRGPLPTSPLPYPSNFSRWFVVTNWNPAASATKLEFNILDTETNYDYLRVYQYSSTGLTLRHEWSGPILLFGSGQVLYTDLIPGRVVFIHFSSDASVEYDGFRVWNYHLN